MGNPPSPWGTPKPFDDDSVTSGAIHRLNADMEHDLSNFAAALRGVHLTPAEKERMRRTIVAMPASQAWSFYFFFSLRQLSAVTAALVILTGATATYAAEGALPGDFLYPMKVEINERIRTRFAMSTSARARWETRLAERRLEEGEILASRGLLTDEAHTDLVNRFQGHAARASANIEMMLADNGETEDAATMSTDFETSLKAHATLLGKLERGHKNRRVLVNHLLDAVRSRTRLVAHVRERAHARVRMVAGTGHGLEATAEARMEKVGKRIDEARSMLAARPPKAGTMAEEAATKLMAVEEEMGRVQDTIETQSIDVALERVNAAFTTAQEVSLFLKHGDEPLNDTSAADVSAEADAAVEARVRLALQRLANTKKFFDQKKEGLSEEAFQAARETLKKAEHALERARMALEDGNTTLAQSQAELSITLSKRARAIIVKNDAGANNNETLPHEENVNSDMDVQSDTNIESDDQSTTIEEQTEGSIRLPPGIEVQQAVREKVDLKLR